MQAGTASEIDKCTKQYAISFDLFEIDDVIDPDAGGPKKPRPVWEWLLSQPNPGPAPSPAPDWNFAKYLVSREGKLVAHWIAPTWPGDNPSNPNDSFDTSAIVIAIKAEIAK